MTRDLGTCALCAEPIGDAPATTFTKSGKNRPAPIAYPVHRACINAKRRAVREAQALRIVNQRLDNFADEIERLKRGLLARRQTLLKRVSELDAITRLWCSACKRTKRRGEFQDREGARGKQYECAKCRAEQHAEATP